MICPLMSGYLLAIGTRDPAYSQCQREECQWWDKGQENCRTIVLLAEIAAWLAKTVSLLPPPARN